MWPLRVNINVSCCLVWNTNIRLRKERLHSLTALKVSFGLLCLSLYLHDWKQWGFYHFTFTSIINLFIYPLNWYYKLTWNNITLKNLLNLLECRILHLKVKKYESVHQNILYFENNFYFSLMSHYYVKLWFISSLFCWRRLIKFASGIGTREQLLALTDLCT